MPTGLPTISRVTTSGPGSTFRYVSDGQLVVVVNREARARVLNPWVVTGFVLVGLVLGIGASLIANADSLPTYAEKVLLIGLSGDSAGSQSSDAGWGAPFSTAVHIQPPIHGTAVREGIRDRGRAGRRRIDSHAAGPDTRHAVRVDRPTAAFWFLRCRSGDSEVARRSSCCRSAMLPDDALEFIRARAARCVARDPGARQIEQADAPWVVLPAGPAPWRPFGRAAGVKAYRVRGQPLHRDCWERRYWPS